MVLHLLPIALSFIRCARCSKQKEQGRGRSRGGLASYPLTYKRKERNSVTQAIIVHTFPKEKGPKRARHTTALLSY